MTSPLEARVSEAGLGDTLVRLRAAVRPLREVPGWATVDLDRARGVIGSRATAAAAGSARPERTAEALLGAFAQRVVDSAGGEVVLLEPSTEGRLAAALARHGEGPAALYLLADPAGRARARAAGFTLTPQGEGPFGPEHLVVGGPRWGPYLIIAPAG